MKKIVLMLLVSLLPVMLTRLPSEAGAIDPELQSRLQSLGPDEEISIIVALEDKVDLRLFESSLHKSLRRSKLVDALKKKADSTQGPLKSLLERRGGKQIKPLWVINALAVTAPKDLIYELATLAGVESIRRDETMLAPVATFSAPTTPEWNLAAIRAPELWNIGFAGAGIVVANMDTGVDLNHPDLKGKWRGGTNSWYDPNGEHETPFDPIGHGTQTMGIMVGGNGGGTAIGIAPDSQWIAVKVYNDAGKTSFSTIHQSFQWLLNPDGDSSTDDAPDVVNASWDLDIVDGCSSEFQQDIQGLKAAGIAIVFSAGNYGPNPSTSVSPSNNPEAFAVGAVDQLNDIADFSSRGPSPCNNDVYPEVVAPGVNIKTSDLTYGGVSSDSYVYVSGTSFSAPHVAGAMALLLSAFPNLAVSDLEFALKESAFDLGTQGPDNVYGYGLVDVAAAYQYLLSHQSLNISVSPASENFGKIRVGTSSVPQRFTVTNQGTEDLVIGALSMSGPDDSEFTKGTDTCSGSTLPPLGTCSVQVTFSPQSTGTKSSSLAIPSNDANLPVFHVPVSGAGFQQFTLTVSMAGTGSGTVTSSPAGIRCGVNCTEIYDAGTTVALTAMPSAGSRFSGWTGDHTGTEATTTLTMDGDRTLTATFDLSKQLTLTRPNGGEIWITGKSQPISWTYLANPGAHVRIELLKGTEFYATIASKAFAGRNGKGSYNWRVPFRIPPGNGYRIRITSKSDSSITDESDSPFTITRATSSDGTDYLEQFSMAIDPNDRHGWKNLFDLL